MNPSPLTAPDLTLRDYFAAHAPAMPDWYARRDADAPDRPDHIAPRDLSSQEEAFSDVWYDWEKFEWIHGVPTDAPQYTSINAWFAEQDAALAAYQRASATYAAYYSTEGKFIRWRWYYADLMLHARNTTAQEGEHQ